MCQVGGQGTGHLHCVQIEREILLEMFIERSDVTLITLGLAQEHDIRKEVVGKVLKIVTVSFPTLYVPGHH